MSKKTPLALKFDTELLKELDEFIEGLQFRPARTVMIETAVREMLERERAKAKGKR